MFNAVHLITYVTMTTHSTIINGNCWLGSALNFIKRRFPQNEFDCFTRIELRHSSIVPLEVCLWLLKFTSQSILHINRIENLHSFGTHSQIGRQINCKLSLTYCLFLFTLLHIFCWNFWSQTQITCKSK